MARVRYPRLLVSARRPLCFVKGMDGSDVVGDFCWKRRGCLLCVDRFILSTCEGHVMVSCLRPSTNHNSGRRLDGPSRSWALSCDNPPSDPVRRLLLLCPLFKRANRGEGLTRGPCDE